MSYRNTDTILRDFEDAFRDAAQTCIEGLKIEGFFAETDTYEKVPFIQVDDYRKLRRILNKVIDDEITRYYTHKPRSIYWPFNDQKLKVGKTLSSFYPKLLRYIIKQNDEEGNNLIAAAGGLPHSPEPYSDEDRHGHCVVKINFDDLVSDTGYSRATIKRNIESLRAAGVLEKLNTTGPQKPLYVIGNWIHGRRNYRVNYRLNRMSLRKNLKIGMLEQNLIELI